MYRYEVEKTLDDGRTIVCFASNGNSKSESGAKIVLLAPGTPRHQTFTKQLGAGNVLNVAHTTCYRGNIGWSAKKEREFVK